MADLRHWWDALWGQVRRSPAVLPTTIAIPPDHTDKPAEPPFERDAHYFTVAVNRIFLQYDRELWKTFAPMALVVSEFQYDGAPRVVPFVVGPSLLEGAGVDLPDTGFMFHDTRVAGIHPYKGGGLTLTVILYRVKRTDLSKKLLAVVERLGSVIDVSQALGTYLKIADLLVDTVGDLVTGDADNQPLIGLRRQFDTGPDFRPGYFALIGGDPIDRAKLWVKDGELARGESMASAQALRSRNYALYSLGQRTARDDYESLTPLGDLWKQVREEASQPQDKDKDLAKAAMASLYQAMMISPDLTYDHAEAEAEALHARMRRIQEGLLRKTSLGAPGEGDAVQVRTRRKALEILSS